MLLLLWHYVKCLWVVLWGLGTKPADPFKTCVLRGIVSPLEIDLMLHCGHREYIKWFEYGRWHQMFKTRLTKQFPRRATYAIAGMMVRWRYSLLLFNQYTIESKFIGFNSEWVFLQQDIMYKNRSVCVAYLKYAILDGTKKLDPSKAFKNLGYSKSPPLPDVFVHWLKAENCTRTGYLEGEKSTNQSSIGLSRATSVQPKKNN